MGDMVEIYRAMDERKRERKEKRLSEADSSGWEKHTEYHWYRFIDGKKLNYWPSTGLVMIGNKRKNINSKYIKALIEKSDNKGN